MGAAACNRKNKSRHGSITLNAAYFLYSPEHFKASGDCLGVTASRKEATLERSFPCTSVVVLVAFGMELGDFCCAFLSFSLAATK